MFGWDWVRWSGDVPTKYRFLESGKPLYITFMISIVDKPNVLLNVKWQIQRISFMIIVIR